MGVQGVMINMGKAPPVPAPWPWEGHLPYPTLLHAPSSLAMNTARDTAHTAEDASQDMLGFQGFSCTNTAKSFPSGLPSIHSLLSLYLCLGLL